MNMLGDTLQLIAVEKAGIIKPSTPVIIGEFQQEIADIFIKKAKLENSEITFASEDELKVESRKLKGGTLDLLDVDVTTPDLNTYNLQLDLPGTYQLKNLKTVLSAVDELRRQGFNITNQHIPIALKQVKTLTGLHGRWEVLNRNPLTICDTGHNPEGIIEVLKNIATVPYQQLHFVIGMVNDKDISKILAMLPTNAQYYFCKPDIPRGLEAESLKQKAESFKLHGEAYLSVPAALKAAQANAGKNDLVFVGGSTFVVAEVV
jgi:dihydrofolate synthase/folylpolyglutamate synthase